MNDPYEKQVGDGKGIYDKKSKSPNVYFKRKI